MARVLIIEDNPSNMKLASLVLSKAGFEVLKASNAIDGIEIATREKPQVILMDVQLPGMDGLEATRRLRTGAATGDLCIIAMTALAMPGDEEKTRQAGCDGYISKPIRYTQLVEQLNLIIQKAGT